jgi:RNA polymerase sigma-70 factor (ECF subfamily)
MAPPDTTSVNEIVGEIYRTESRRILATLIRLLGDFEIAEEAMHDAFNAALEKWAVEGIPSNPRAWIVSTGKFKAIDGMRRQSRFDASSSRLIEHIEGDNRDPADGLDDAVPDDQLRLIFTCCHPALSPDARIALTLREVCGLSTEEIARAYLTRPSAIAQRIVRAKAKIREAAIPYQLPTPADVPERLDTVLHVIYLVFNEGYSASFGASLTRSDLSGEAIRLGRLLADLLPQAEVLGLLALMLLQESRRSARSSPSGDLVLLEDQDRSLWDRALIKDGLELVGRVHRLGRFGPYALQAAIAAEYAKAASPKETNWNAIVGLYEVLLRIAPSPVIELNGAIALAMRDGVEAGLGKIEALLARGELADYRFAHAARADLLRRLGRNGEARTSYEAALRNTTLEPERRFLERRLKEVDRS